MTKYLLIALMWAGCAGCYREPTDPTQVRQNAESRRAVAEPATPADTGSAEPADADADTQNAIIASRDVPVGSYVLTAPDQWVRKKLDNQFLLAEFALPKAEGDADDGRLTVSTAGGTVEENIERWKRQFGGTPESASQETVKIGDIEVTWVDYAGTFTDQRGFMAASPPRAGYRMLGAIIPLGKQLFFVKGYGPQKTVAAYADQIRSFVQSLKPNSAVDSNPAPHP